MIEKQPHRYFEIIIATNANLKIRWANKRLVRDGHVTDYPVKTKVANIMAKVIEANEIPCASKMHQPVRINLAGFGRVLAATGKTSVIFKAYGVPLDDGPSQRRKEFMPDSRRSHNELDAALQIGNFRAKFRRKHCLYLASGGSCRSPVLGVYILAHKVAAEQEHYRFVRGKAERRQKITLNQAVALTGDGDERHAGFSQRQHVAINRPLAHLEGRSEVFGPLLAFCLQLQQKRQ